MSVADRSLGRRVAVLVVSVMLAGAALRAQADSAPLPPKWQKLVGTFDDTLKKASIVGGSIALVEGGRIVARHNYGYADRDGNRKVDNDTIFHWASITKTLNAIAMMQLRDRGLISLDDPVTRLVPELRRMHNEFGSMDAITIRMLLDHSAGFQAATWPYKEGAAWEPFEPTRWEQLVSMMPYQKVEFAPGTKFSYSNPAWIYAARILEELTGDPWQYYIHKNIFMPLGMSRSYVSYTPDYLRAHRSNRYYVEKGADGSTRAVAQGGEFNPGITIPNGGWNSPLEDVAAYIGFLTSASGGDREKQERYDTVLRRSSLEEMWQPRLSLGDGEGHIGYGFFLIDDAVPRVIGHTGGQGGFSSYFYINPQTGRGIIAAFNTAGGGAFSALQKAGVEVLR